MLVDIAALNLNDMLELKMQYDSERQKVLAQNIASKDIPGYRAQDLKPLDFSNILAAKTSKVAMMTTSSLHMGPAKTPAQQFMHTPDGDPFEVSPTGNSVVTEEQMMKVAQNAMDFQMSTNLYKKVGNLFREALGLQPSP